MLGEASPADAARGGSGPVAAIETGAVLRALECPPDETAGARGIVGTVNIEIVTTVLSASAVGR